MRETARTSDELGVENTPPQQPIMKNEVMRRAFGNALDLNSGKNEISVEDVTKALVEMGIDVSSENSATVIDFPLSKTSEEQKHREQEQLGKEVGLDVKNAIEEHQKRLSGATISNMENEKTHHSATETFRVLPNHPPIEKNRNTLEVELSKKMEQLNEIKENLARGVFSPPKDGGEEGDKIFAQSLENEIALLETELGIENTSSVEEPAGKNPESAAEETSPVSYKSPLENDAFAVPPISYKDPSQIVNTVTKEVPLKSEQEAPASTKESAASNNEFGRSLLYDETIRRINEDASAVKQKTREATVQLRDHLVSAKEPNEVLAWAEKRIIELNKEREDHIRNVVKNASIDEVRAIKRVSEEDLKNNFVLDKSEATTAGQEARKRIAEYEVGNNKQKNIETMASNLGGVGVEKVTEHEKPPAQQRLLSMEVRRTFLMDRKRNKISLSTEELAELARLTEEIQTLRGEISSIPTAVVTPLVEHEQPPVEINSAHAELTSEAIELISSVESGVPAFITSNLRRIAEENGIDISPKDSPSDIIKRLKQKRDDASSTPQQETPLKAEEAPLVSQVEEGIPPLNVEEKPKTQFEKAMGKIAGEDPARAERLLKTIGATPEMRKKFEKCLGALQTIEEGTVEKESKAGILDLTRKWGEKYYKLPLKVKIGIGALLIGGSLVTGGAGLVGGAVSFGLGIRGIALGAGTFWAVESAGLRWVDSKMENKKLGRGIATATGLLAGILIGGAGKTIFDYYDSLHGATAEVTTLPLAATEPLDLDSKEIFASTQKDIHEAIPLQGDPVPQPITGSVLTPEKQFFETSPEVSGSVIMTPESQLFSAEASIASPFESSHVVESGDKLWNILKEKVPGIQNLDGEAKQSNAIANILEQIRKDPKSFGITSGNVDNLTAGDTLNMEKVHGILENTKISVGGNEMGLLERAENLSASEVSSIEANNAKISLWHEAHPDVPLTTETVDNILNGNDVSATTGVEQSSTIENAEKYANVRKDMESVEAVSMKTERIFRADIQTLFGSKGLFGYGFLGTNGERSVDWLDLKDRAVSEVMSKKFEGVPLGEEDSVTKSGIDSFNAVDKMKGYMKMLTEKTGFIPKETETVNQFVHRAIQAIASK